MATRPTSRNDDLATLYSRFLDRQTADWRRHCAAVCQERARKLGRLTRRGVRTVDDLLKQLPSLPQSLRLFAIELTFLLKLRRAIPALLDLMQDAKCGRAVRLSCASALNILQAGRKIEGVFVRIGRRELVSAHPDRDWLEAVILGLGVPDTPQAVDLLVTIFERDDLPGSIRGDAADKLGCVGLVCDRRTSQFRRCRQAALRGLTDKPIDVQFWSMYLIGRLCVGSKPQRQSRVSDFDSALPRLRDVAATDRRLAPGYWWPMSGEAEDVICCIETGMSPESDASDRWPDTTKRGKYGED